MKIRGMVGVVLAGLTLACSTQIRASSLDGVWESEGYGLLLEIRQADVRVWQTTAASCLLAFSSRRQPAVPEGAEAAFSMPAEMGGLTIQIRPGASDDLRRLKVVGTASDIGLRRIAGKPSTCAALASGQGPGDPRQTFEVFVQTFREQYPFFAVRGVDWERAVAAAHQELGDSRDPATLFQVMLSLISPLQDAHTFLTAPSLSDRSFEGFRQSQTAPRTLADLISRRERIASIIETSLSGGLHEYANKKLRFGWLDREAGVGYLRVTGFEKYSSNPDFAVQLMILNQTLDAVLVPGLRSLVVDVRINLGGLDELGLALMSRLTDQRFLAYRKAARDDMGGVGGLTAPAAVFVEPGPGPRFTGPLVLLTSPFTVSAAETFTLASMQRPELTTRVGTTTQGVFSDMQSRVLPNGWQFGLPTEVYTNPAGQGFEGRGILPDQEVPSFTEEQLAQGHDLVLERSLQLLRASR